MVSIQNLYKKFGNNEVLKGINTSIESGKIVAVLGPNGSGKTTLIKSILGMTIPNKGSISINDQKIHKNGNYRNDIDYLPQIANFPGNLSVRELVKMVKDLRNKPTNDEGLIELFKLEPFLNKKLTNLSGGTKQKVNLVLCLMFDSPLLILDEPTTGLDPIALLHLKALIEQEKQKGKTIILTSHIMSFVEEVADDVIFLLEGEIYFQGSAEALKESTNQHDFENAIAQILNQQHA